MALFILTVIILLNNFSCLLSSEDIDHSVDELEITPSTYTGDRYFGVYEVENTLNLSCILKNATDMENVLLDWIIPIWETNRADLTVMHVGSSLLNLVIKNVTENDSGEYKCTAINMKLLRYSEKSIVINVKNKKGECSEMMFQCSCGMCIHKRYTCDGFKDCHHGEDESPSYCGPGSPCDSKIRCPDGRCIPYAWCCDLHREENCTTLLKHDCCIPHDNFKQHSNKLTHGMDSDIGFHYKDDKFYDWGFLQTTAYITIGYALAFTGMFIVIIIVIVTCRMHMRRSLTTRCPSTSPPRNFHGTRHSIENCVPSYDLDVYFNRHNTNDLMTVNPLLVSYNIGNGVQFVGRPVEPPPYCEILRSPPKEGPPPPYVSLENLALQRRESGEGKESAEDSESETLLDSQSQISVISSNVIDNAERSSLAGRDESQRLDSKLVGARSPELIVLKDQCPDRTSSSVNDSPKSGSLVLHNDGSEQTNGNESPRNDL